MSEFRLGAYTYRTGRLGAIPQFHVARKIAPLMGAFKDTDIVRAAISSQPMSEADKLASAVTMISPLTEVISSMPEDDVNYVLDKTLSVVMRCEGDAVPGKPWANIWHPGSRSLMFDDIDMATMVQIVYYVIMDQFTGFFPDRLSA